MKGARTDSLSPEQRQHTMSRVRSKNTKLEMTVRRLVHSMGYRYRLHKRNLFFKVDYNQAFPWVGLKGQQERGRRTMRMRAERRIQNAIR
ncbi:hypothetical protein ACFL4G_03735 [Thermodesulfobacteriota bacterium]